MPDAVSSHHDIRQFRPARWVPWALGVALLGMVAYLLLTSVPESFAGEVTGAESDRLVVQMDTDASPEEGDEVSLEGGSGASVQGVVTSVDVDPAAVTLTVDVADGSGDLGVGSSVTGELGEHSFFSSLVGERAP